MNFSFNFTDAICHHSLIFFCIVGTLAIILDFVSQSQFVLLWLKNTHNSQVCPVSKRTFMYIFLPLLQKQDQFCTFLSHKDELCPSDILLCPPPPIPPCPLKLPTRLLFQTSVQYNTIGSGEWYKPVFHSFQCKHGEPAICLFHSHGLASQC